MINLPAAFTERMKQMLGREYDAFIASLRQGALTGTARERTESGSGGIC